MTELFLELQVALDPLARCGRGTATATATIQLVLFFSLMLILYTAILHSGEPSIVEPRWRSTVERS